MDRNYTNVSPAPTKRVQRPLVVLRSEHAAWEGGAEGEGAGGVGTVHLHIQSHGSQRLLSTEPCLQRGAVRQPDLPAGGANGINAREVTGSTGQQRTSRLF